MTSLSSLKSALALGLLILPFMLSAQDDARRVLPVRTVAVERAEAYSILRQYTGQWEAARTSQLGFELGGTLLELNVEEGETIPSGALLARVDTLRLDARKAEIKAALAEARAGRDLAESTFTRIAEAAARGAVSDQRRDEAAQELALREATLARVEAQLVSVETDLDKAILRAPFAGTVTKRWVDEGQVVGAGSPVLTLQETEAWELRVGLSARQAAQINVGETVMINHRGESLEGMIVRVLPARDGATRTVDVIVQPRIRMDFLRAGDLATVGFARTQTQDGVWLPLSALTEDVRGLWATYVTMPTETPGEYRLERRSLTVQHLAEGRAFVSGPLVQGELVVAEGLHRIVSDQRVRLVN